MYHYLKKKDITTWKQTEILGIEHECVSLFSFFLKGTNHKDYEILDIKTKNTQLYGC